VDVVGVEGGAEAAPPGLEGRVGPARPSGNRDADGAAREMEDHLTRLCQAADHPPAPGRRTPAPQAPPTGKAPLQAGPAQAIRGSRRQPVPS
jgi:hypothetical protein